MSKICVVHGVGFFGGGSQKTIADFCRRLEARTGAKVIVKRWEHPGSSPADPRRSWLFPKMKAWVHEVIMDFSYVVSNLSSLKDLLPDADMYIGHSAGGVIISQTDKPQVLMGCPIQLVYNVRVKAEAAEVMNIMHYRDPIAASLSGAFNVIAYKPLIRSVVNPIAAHTGYWDSDEVMGRIVGFYNARLKGEGG